MNCPFQLNLGGIYNRPTSVEKISSIEANEHRPFGWRDKFGYLFGDFGMRSPF